MAVSFAPKLWRNSTTHAAEVGGAPSHAVRPPEREGESVAGNGVQNREGFRRVEGYFATHGTRVMSCCSSTATSTSSVTNPEREAEERATQSGTKKAEGCRHGSGRFSTRREGNLFRLTHILYVPASATPFPSARGRIFFASCGRGETGKHKGLKIPRLRPCRFESGRPHQEHQGRIPPFPGDSASASRFFR